MATPKLTPDQIAQVSDLVADYISARREKYARRAIALSAEQRAAVAPFFASELLANTRVLVLQGERVPNPDFYPMLRNLGFLNVPDQSSMANWNEWACNSRGLDASVVVALRNEWRDRFREERKLESSPLATRSLAHIRKGLSIEDWQNLYSERKPKARGVMSDSVASMKSA